jgi:hypothetical protein
VSHGYWTNAIQQNLISDFELANPNPPLSLLKFSCPGKVCCSFRPGEIYQMPVRFSHDFWLAVLLASWTIREFNPLGLFLPETAKPQAAGRAALKKKDAVGLGALSSSAG